MYSTKVLSSALEKMRKSTAIENVLMELEIYNKTYKEESDIYYLYSIFSKEKVDEEVNAYEFLSKIKTLFALMRKDYLKDFIDPMHYLNEDLFFNDICENTKELLIAIDNDLKLSLFLKPYIQSLSRVERNITTQQNPGYTRYNSTYKIIIPIAKKLTLNQFEEMIPLAIATVKNIISFTDKRSGFEDEIVDMIADYLKKDRSSFSDINLVLGIFSDKQNAGFKMFEIQYDEIAKKPDGQNEYTDSHFGEFIKSFSEKPASK